jgi:hypothetical protein
MASTYSNIWRSLILSFLQYRIFFLQPCFFLKSIIFWDITPCSPLKVNRPFEVKYGRISHLLSGLYLALLIRPWWWRRYFPPKRRFTFNGLHGVIFQKIVFFITTAVRTSSPTYVSFRFFLSFFLPFFLSSFLLSFHFNSFLLSPHQQEKCSHICL